MSGKKREQLQSSLQVKNFFLEYTDAQIDAYDNDIVRAVRMRNIDDLRAMHLSGKEMQCANRFGESILHIACRRGFVDVIRFLVLFVLDFLQHSLRQLAMVLHVGVHDHLL